MNDLGVVLTKLNRLHDQVSELRQLVIELLCDTDTPLSRLDKQVWIQILKRAVNTWPDVPEEVLNLLYELDK